MKAFVHIVMFFVVGFLFSSCEKDFYASTKNDRLSFSSDTVSFDTVFTEKGTLTQCIKIKNENKGIIKIDRMSVAKNRLSEFYINVNGVQGPCVENIDIAAGDSIFVFVQSKLHSQDVDTVLYHKDVLKIEYNTVVDSVIICAWGQDVVNLKGETVFSTTFTANKPYVVYDSLVVASGETLTIDAGARIYMHYNANILVYGTLLILGTSENPVVISSDRLEETYQLLPGQWGSIVFKASSTDNVIEYAKIINGVNGLIFEGTAENDIQCDIHNSRISNMSGYCVYANNAHIDTYNSVFANCNYSVLAINAGWFNAVHCTIYNEGSASGRKYYPSVVVGDNANNEYTALLKQAYFYNSIIAGTTTNEIVFESHLGDNKLPCIIQSCLIRDTYTSADSVYYKENVFYDRNTNLFVATENFMLDTLSQAKDIGDIKYANIYPLDLLNNSRVSDGKPDVGAMEYYYEAKEN